VPRAPRSHSHDMRHNRSGQERSVVTSITDRAPTTGLLRHSDTAPGPGAVRRSTRSKRSATPERGEDVRNPIGTAAVVEGRGVGRHTSCCHVSVAWCSLRPHHAYLDVPVGGHLAPCQEEGVEGVEGALDDRGHRALRELDLSGEQQLGEQVIEDSPNLMTGCRSRSTGSTLGNMPAARRRRRGASRR
jgi:hypothetical protein